MLYIFKNDVYKKSNPNIKGRLPYNKEQENKFNIRMQFDEKEIYGNINCFSYIRW